MEPFSILCTTCQVRLKVRDPSVIGQILTCPKCGSMVLVSPPAGKESTDILSDTVVDPGPIGDVHGDAAGDSPPFTPRPPELPREAETERFDPIDDEPPQDVGTANGTESSSDDFEPEEVQDDFLEEALLPDDQWTSERARLWRSWLLGGGAALVGTLLAIGLFGFVASRLAGDGTHHVMTDPALASAVEPRTDSGLPDEKERSLTDEPVGTGRASDQEEVRQPGADSPLQSKPPTSVSPSIDDRPPQDQIEIDRTPRVPIPLPPADGLPPTTATAEAAVPGEPSSASADAEPGPPGLTPRDAATTAADRLTGNSNLTQMLEQFGALLNDSEPAFPDTVETGPEAIPEDPPEETRSDLEAAASVPRPQPRVIDVAARLEDRFEGIQYTDVPMIDFLRFITNYSTIPITLHPESLSWLRISPEAPLSLQQRDCTVAQVLEAALGPVGLGFELADGKLLVRRPAASEMREARFDVDDLTGGDEQLLAELAELLRSVVAPTTWHALEGAAAIETTDTALSVRQHEDILFEVLFFCERLRVARGLKTRSSFAEGQFKPVPRYQRARANLDQRVTLTVLRPTPFSRVLQLLEKTSGVRLLVDWHFLDHQGWNPDAVVTFSVHDLSFEQALDSLLSPMDLGFRVVDDSVFQISSQERLSGLLEIEFYPATLWLPAGQTVEAALEALRAAVAHEGSYTAESGEVWTVDPVSRTLLVLANQATHRRVGSLLAAD